MATANQELEALLVRAVEAGLRGSPHDARQIAMRLGRPARRTPLVSDGTRRKFEQLVADPDLAARSARPAPSVDAPSQRTSPSPDIREIGGAVPSIEEPSGQRRPLLPDPALARLSRILREQERREQLLAAGVRPTSTLLLSGPPGVGKTHTAKWLASELRLPIAHIEPAVVLSSLLGRSGQNLVSMLQSARRRPSVVLIDEFDALAKRRDDSADIGELKRLVTVLLLELDRWPAGHLLIAATNHPHLLDAAIQRRFDHVLELGLPDGAARRRMLTDALIARATPVSGGLVDALTAATEGAHGGTLIAVADDIARAVLVDDEKPDDAATNAALRLLAAQHGPQARDAFCWVAHHHGGLPMREIGRRLGVTHPTVSSAIERFDRVEH